MNDLTEEDRSFASIWELCQPFTMASFERGLALFRAVRYLAVNDIAGDFVECGVWRGGSSMIAMLTFMHFGVTDRRFWLFDTFDGMTEPAAIDVDLQGNAAAALMEASLEARQTELIWAYATVDEVKDHVVATGYPLDRVHFVKGDIRRTAAASDTGPLALLRLDTDFYDSTSVELEAFYPRLIDHGVLLIDDYGHWQGARRAVDEYFDKMHLAGETYPLFHKIDYTGRMAIKPASRRRPPERYDYYSPSLVRAGLLFPSLLVRDPEPIDWPYLRKAAPHIWRTDSRSLRLPDTGVLSVEEAEILYNAALPMAGRRGLEIGCHYGWSTAHLLAAGLHLDVVDPALGYEDQWRDVEESLSAVPTQGSYALCAAFSPSVVPAVRALSPEPWSFAFIDGYHEGDAPLKDAMTVERYCAETACVMFHDLTSPFVTGGIRHLARQGWRTGLYNTMQIMGVAWRGNFTPVAHRSDPRMPPIDQPHLAEFTVLSR